MDEFSREKTPLPVSKYACALIPPPTPKAELPEIVQFENNRRGVSYTHAAAVGGRIAGNGAAGDGESRSQIFREDASSITRIDIAKIVYSFKGSVVVVDGTGVNFKPPKIINARTVKCAIAGNGTVVDRYPSFDIEETAPGALARVVVIPKSYCD